MKNKKTKTAFSIIELSIVVVIISILIGSILIANRMYENAKLTAAQTLTKSSPVVDMEGLTLWLETTMPQSFNDEQTDDGETITTWYDLSNTKKEFTGTATYTADGLNNLPVLSFNGSSNSFSRSNSLISDFVKANQGTVFLVQNYTSGNSSSTIFWQTGSIRINTHALHSSGVLYFDFGTCCAASGRTTYTPSGFAGRSNIVTLVKYPSSASIIINGSVVTTNGSASGSFATSVQSTFYLGYSGSAGFAGNISEIIIFERALSDDEIEEIEKYLSKKWGITIS